MAKQHQQPRQPHTQAAPPAPPPMRVSREEEEPQEQEQPQSQPKKADMMREALAELGGLEQAKPKEMAAYILKKYGQTVDPAYISTFKSQEAKKAGNSSGLIRKAAPSQAASASADVLTFSEALALRKVIKEMGGMEAVEEALLVYGKLVEAVGSHQRLQEGLDAIKQWDEE